MNQQLACAVQGSMAPPAKNLDRFSVGAGALFSLAERVETSATSGGFERCQRDFANFAWAGAARLRPARARPGKPARLPMASPATAGCRQGRAGQRHRHPGCRLKHARYLVTLTLVEAGLFAASRATTWIVCAPADTLRVFQVYDRLPPVTAAFRTPSM